MRSDLSRYPGKPTGWKPQSELDHFMTCPVCGRVFDCRDLGKVYEHWHDGPGEITHGVTTEKPGRHRDDRALVAHVPDRSALETRQPEKGSREKRLSAEGARSRSVNQ